MCCGPAIPNLYAFLEQRGELAAESWVTEQLEAADDPPPVIVEAALRESGHSRLCAASLDLFAAILAAEAGNTALRLLATGGVYLAGSLVRRILPILEQPAFLDDFRHKGRMSDLLERVPLHVVTKPDTALLGAIQYALDGRNAGA